jgi:glycosyltransferase involved in cell wall biosynthesis
MISVTVPTRNSAGTLQRCLDSVYRQEVDDGLEVLVIDGESSDATVAIAADTGARVLSHRGALLGARRRGLDESHGDIVVLLDSDQILRAGALKRASTQIAEGAGMVVMGERVWSPRTLVERLSDLDKRLLAMNVAAQLDPRRGVLLPRVFRRDVLANAFAAIPAAIDDTCIAHDHAIIYWESSRFRRDVAYAPDCVWHVEPAGVVDLWRKNFRYGWSTRELFASGLYRELVSEKTRRRQPHSRSPVHLQMAALGFLALKAPAYVMGYAVGHRASASRGPRPPRGASMP